MAKKSNPREKTVTPRPIESLIHVIRGQKVMVDADLADLYGVPTGALNQAVTRNTERFPGDFAFRLSKEEFEHWKSQIVISNPSAKMGLRHAPLVFTQEGVAMLSAVLRSDRAVQMSIAIVRTFVRMRELMAANKDIAARVEKLERGHDRTASNAGGRQLYRCNCAPPQLDGRYRKREGFSEAGREGFQPVC